MFPAKCDTKNLGFPSKSVAPQGAEPSDRVGVYVPMCFVASVSIPEPGATRVPLQLPTITPTLRMFLGRGGLSLSCSGVPTLLLPGCLTQHYVPTTPPAFGDLFGVATCGLVGGGLSLLLFHVTSRVGDGGISSFIIWELSSRLVFFLDPGLGAFSAEPRTNHTRALPDGFNFTSSFASVNVDTNTSRVSAK